MCVWWWWWGNKSCRKKDRVIWELFLKCFLQNSTLWRVLRKKWGKLTTGKKWEQIFLLEYQRICFSVGCSGYYKKISLKFLSYGGRHLNTYFNVSLSSLFCWTQTLQSLSVWMYVCHQAWRVGARGHAECRCSFALLIACRYPAFGSQ